MIYSNIKFVISRKQGQRIQILIEICNNQHCNSSAKYSLYTHVIKGCNHTPLLQLLVKESDEKPLLHMADKTVPSADMSTAFPLLMPISGHSI